VLSLSDISGWRDGVLYPLAGWSPKNSGAANYGFGGALRLDLLGPPGRRSGCWLHDGEVAGGAVADFILVISGSGRCELRVRFTTIRSKPLAEGPPSRARDNGSEKVNAARRAARREVAHVIEGVNPYDGSTITRIQRASAEDVSDADCSARAAQRDWAGASPRERGSIMTHAAAITLARRKEIVPRNRCRSPFDQTVDRKPRSAYLFQKFNLSLVSTTASRCGQ
jgi:hypothetical protein